jgi:sulfate/thiosulfate transport system substrate-binding protein
MHRSLARLALALALLAVPVGVAACGGGDDTATAGGGGGGKLTLVAYSTPKEAYDALIPAFEKTTDGSGLKISSSYGASGDQARAVLAGLPADVVALSLAPDVNKLVDGGLVAKNWNQGEFKGFVTQSVVVLVVRKGNPKNIHGWDDLIKPGVQVITPNPFTSGGARWNIMAGYGAQLEQGKSEAQATEYLKQLFKNVVVQDKSAREALQTFAAGKGDVLISYENEAITAQQKGQDVDYVIPDQTILIQNPIAVVSKSKNPQKAAAFVTYLESPAAQKIYASKGYRSVREDLVDKSKFPAPPGLFTIDKLGGWSTVNDKFFDPEKGVVAGIERDNGVATG